MRKKCIYIIMAVMVMCCLTACTKEEEAKKEEPVSDVGMLLDKYTDNKDEEESESKNNETENNSDDEIDYDKLDEALINDIVANGGSSFSGAQIANVSGDVSANGMITYTTDGFELFETGDGYISYLGDNKFDAVAVYSYDLGTNLTKEFVINSYENEFKTVYGNYISKSTYTNTNGIEFLRYKYNEYNNLRSGVLIEVFLYTDGQRIIILETAVSSHLRQLSDDCMDLINSVKFN